MQTLGKACGPASEKIEQCGRFPMPAGFCEIFDRDVDVIFVGQLIEHFERIIGWVGDDGFDLETFAEFENGSGIRFGLAGINDADTDDVHVNGLQLSEESGRSGDIGWIDLAGGEFDVMNIHGMQQVDHVGHGSILKC